MKKILVVDDDKEIAMLMSDSLMDEGFKTILAYDGQTALTIINQVDDLALIILDIMMPNVDGLEVCRKIRDVVSCPIIFVTAKNRTYDNLLGFEMGADDYITKPFVVEELIARVKAHLRREHRNNNLQKNIIQIGDIKLVRESYEVFLNSVPVDVSTREFQLLSYFFDHAGLVLTKEQIFNAVWGEEFGDIGTVAVNVKNLRDKLDKNHNYIKTVWGIGYKLVKNIEGRT